MSALYQQQQHFAKIEHKNEALFFRVLFISPDRVIPPLEARQRQAVGTWLTRSNCVRPGLQRQRTLQRVV